jgi:hypothetical protein
MVVSSSLVDRVELRYVVEGVLPSRRVTEYIRCLKCYRISNVLFLAMKKALAISYADLTSQFHQSRLISDAYQHMAVLGMVVTMRGFSPRKKPLQPLRCRITVAACHRPRTLRSSGSVDDPRVWSNVLMTSSGVVTPAANPPAMPPAKQCVYGSYLPVGLSTFDMDS